MTPTQASLLSIRNLSVSYDKVQAVHGVSVDVADGAIVTVIGANGAGKSSLLNAVMGLVPASGTVQLRGVEQSERPVSARVAAGLSLVPERRELFGSMSVEDNLQLGAYRATGGKSLDEELAGVYARFPRLKERRRQIASTLSGGERQMLAMGRALMARARVLMLDEPSLGLAPRMVVEILDIVVDLRSAGVSTLLVEQNARAALEIADYAYVMELGAVARHGPARQYLQDKSIVESYLGASSQETERRAIEPGA